MNNDNSGDKPTDDKPKDNIVSLEAFRKGQPETKEVNPPKPEPGLFEFHFYPSDTGFDPEVITSHGFLKFGPQFIAVLEGPEDFNNVSFTCATNSVKYIKKLGKDKEVQGSLSL